MSFAWLPRVLRPRPSPLSINPRSYAIIHHEDWTEPQKIGLPYNATGPHEIGSSPRCWLTLPDPSLPDIVGILFHAGNHKYLRELPKIDYGRADDIDIHSLDPRRVDKHPFTLGGYTIAIDFGY